MLVLVLAGRATAGYPGWKHSGSVFVLTTPQGTNLPAGSSVEGFPLLVRLHKDFFDFRQVQVNGQDLRFASNTGEPLAYQIEEWNADKGVASIWVRVPKIQGNSRQEIKLYWGKADAKNESNGKAVFNESNDFVGVLHMSGPVKDETETLESKDSGTTPSVGIIGPSRHFVGRQGVFSGDKISNYPSGVSSHSTEAWFRAETPNATIVGWGNEGGGRGSKIRMQLRSPPHIHIDSDFSDVRGEARLPLREWVHVVHTYERENGKIYINGKLDSSAKPVLNIKSPARLWIGGWYHNYDFVGDIDEVRISKVARSADWIRLQYENQKPLQTLVGPVVQPDNEFGLPEMEVAVLEGRSLTFTAKAGGAQKVYWIVKRDGKETVVATDRFAFTFDAGRVVGNQSVVLQFRAVYANEVKTKDIAVAIEEDIPEPVFTLRAPASWDGREAIEVVSQIANLNEMRAKGASQLNTTWSVSPIATTQEVAPGKLILKRAQNSGTTTVTATVDNGGKPTVQTATIAVTEPAKDVWVARTPAKDEKPEEGQFYARDDKNEGTLFYNGTIVEGADGVFLKLYADDKLIHTATQKPSLSRSRPDGPS